MNLYLKARLTGKLTSTSKLEKQMEAMPALNKRYRDIEKSELLNEYRQLDALLQSEEYKSNKAKTARLAQLKKNKKVVNYLKLVDDKCLKQYFAFAANTERYALLSDTKAVKADSELKQMKKIDGSKALATWRDVEHCSEVTEYLELCKTVVDYTQQEERYKSLKGHSDITFFFAEDAAKHDKYNAFDKVLDDNFEMSDISHKGWKAGFAYPAGLKNVHSYTSEQQAYMGGKNVSAQNSVLTLATKKEDVTAAAWDEKKGMVNMDFHFTSDVIYNETEIREGDVLQLKMRCSGKIHHGIYLRSKKNVPFISVLNYTGKRSYCGLKGSQSDREQSQEIAGLRPSPFAIYTMIWGKDEIIWYLNDMEVARTKNTIHESLYLHLMSSCRKGEHASAGRMEVDWVKVFRQK